jgi:hypothetical protein
LDAIAQGSDDSEQFIGRTVFENDSNESREEVDVYLTRAEEHAQAFHALSSRFGLTASMAALPPAVADYKHKHEKQKQDYKKHVENMKKQAESLYGPEEQRSNYSEQSSILEADLTEDEAYNATQRDKDMFIRFLIEQLKKAKNVAVDLATFDNEMY